MSWQ